MNGKKKVAYLVIIALFLSNLGGLLFGARGAVALANPTGDYTSYASGNTFIKHGLKNLRITGSNVQEEVVYCYEASKNFPEEDGTPGYSRSTFRDPSMESAVKKIVYYGYPNDKGGLQKEYQLGDDQFRAITQFAIWRYTDGMAREAFHRDLKAEGYPAHVVNHSLAAYDRLVNATQNPSPEFSLHFYHVSDLNATYQNLLGSSYIVSTTYREVTFSKTEVNGTVELEGAHLQVYQGEGQEGKLLDEWISTAGQKKMVLESGVYTMVETMAPKGYEVAESITFRITEQGTLEVKNGDQWIPRSEALIRMEDALKPMEEEESSSSEAESSESSSSESESSVNSSSNETTEDANASSDDNSVHVNESSESGTSMSQEENLGQDVEKEPEETSSLVSGNDVKKKDSGFNIDQTDRAKEKENDGSFSIDTDASSSSHEAAPKTGAEEKVVYWMGALLISTVLLIRVIRRIDNENERE